MFSWLNRWRQNPPSEQTPLQRMLIAAEELNSAWDDMVKEDRHVSPWIDWQEGSVQVVRRKFDREVINHEVLKSTCH